MARAGLHGDAHGHLADRPSEIPKAGWKAVLLRVKDGIRTKELDIIAAGVAFNEFFALFPALVAAVSVYGLAVEPQTVQEHMAQVARMLPGEAADLVKGQLQSLTANSGGALGLSVAISVLVALWGATRGIKALIEGLNIVYDEDEKRGFIKLNAVALGLTAGALLFGLAALLLVAALPAVIDLLPLGDTLKTVANWVRWPLLGLFLLGSLSVVYRYAPSREQPKWRWVSWGAVLAAALWLLGSAAFSFYAAHFGNFNKTYGSLAAVAVLLLWLQLTAFVVLLGALLDAELEHQTARDTTETNRPLGQRGATKADTVAGD